jgi:hypothetical protein
MYQRRTAAGEVYPYWRRRWRWGWWGLAVPPLPLFPEQGIRVVVTGQRRERTERDRERKKGREGRDDIERGS